MISKDLGREKFYLFSLFCIAFGLRIMGVGFGLPFLYHADEPIVVNHALAYGLGDFNPHFFNIPPLISYLLFGCYGIYFLLGFLGGLFQSLQDFEYLFYFDPTSFYLIARIVFGVILGTATVFAVYRLAKRFWNLEVAMLSAFFLAVCFLHVRDSHYIYPDIPLVFVMVFGIYQILKLDSSCKKVKQHMVVGFFIGLAAAIKYNGVFLLLPYIWLLFRIFPFKHALKCLGIASAISLGSFILFNPFALIDGQFFIKEILEESRAHSGGVDMWHHMFYSMSGAVGIPLLLVSVCGVLRSFFVRNVRAEAVGIFILGYYAVLCLGGQPYDRYVLPMLPFMLLVAAEFFVWMKNRFFVSRIIFSILLILLIVPTLAKSLRSNEIMLAKDVRTVAKKWVEENIPSGSKIALGWSFYMPRLNFSEIELVNKKASLLRGEAHAGAKERKLDALLSQKLKPSYQLHFLVKDPFKERFLFETPAVAFNVEDLKRKGIEYVFLLGGVSEREDAFAKELLAYAEILARFSPFTVLAKGKEFDQQPLTGGPFKWSDLFSRERNGYPIKIYKLNE